MKTTLTKIITAALSASTLALSASAYTIPEYSFDISKYQCKSCSMCDEFSAPDALDSEISPNCVLIVLKGEYSYPNSVWTAEDFPELAEAGLSVEGVTDLSNFDEKDDEWIESYLSRVSFHQILSVDLGAYDYVKVRQVRDAIVEATLAGNHPEFALVEFNIIFTEDSTPIYSDLNGDEVINSIDVTMITRHALGSYALDDSVVTYADVNLDGSVNSIDATMLLRYVLKIDA